MTMHRSLSLLALLVVCNCHPASPGPPPPPVADSDCKRMCEHLDKLRCDVRSPDGLGCEDVLCQVPGVKVECVLQARSCEEANRLQSKGCR